MTALARAVSLHVMCNLYKLNRTAAEVAQLFNAIADPGANFAEEVYPGYPGLVVAEGRVRAMTWGFPLSLRGKQGQPLKPKPVNNTRSDKLLGGFWRPSFAARRCLIPLTAFAEADGERGRMTRTWFTLAGEETMTVAGIWRDSIEWGPVYSMVMTDGCVQMGPIHDRMPVILADEDAAVWTHGSVEAALALCRPYEGLLRIDRTAEPWSARR